MLWALLLPQAGSAQADKPTRVASRRRFRRLVYILVRTPRGGGKLRGSPGRDKCTQLRCHPIPPFSVAVDSTIASSISLPWLRRA